MMGRLSHDQEQFFYSFRLDEAVPEDHAVREIAAVLDLSWAHSELAPYYPEIGRPSIDPVLMIRMLIVGYVFGIRSERGLCREVQVNLAYRWFCGLSIEDKVPDHSAFSRARNERFGNSNVFRCVFERIVGTCIAAGLVGGEGFAVDASLIQADANKHRSIPGAEWHKDIDPEQARLRSIWRRSTRRPTARQVTSRQNSSHHPILPRNGLERCATQRSSHTPTTISST
jgi:transposase